MDRLTTLPDDKADNALILGKAMHTGLEKGLEAAIKEYFGAYPIITDEHINEAMKLEYWIPKARELLPQGKHEIEIQHKHFIGYIDLLAPVTLFHDQPAPNLYDLYDFKYTADGSRYRDSKQLHLYKHFFEATNPGSKIRNLHYLIIPKVRIKQKKTESLAEFRQRIESELLKKKLEILTVDFDPQKVIDFTLNIKELLETTEYPKEPQYLCNWCEFQDYCERGIDYMLLPKNERRDIQTINKKVIWLYGSPFTGKTTFANKFPDPLMLNTDGNIRFVDSPYLSIKDKVEVEGRMTKRTLAWENFKDMISELEKKENDFKTIIVDLVEDTYEYSRLYMYREMNITHESDESFKAWDKVTVEFLSTIKRLMNLDYENIILISHEDTNKDITKKGGDKLTAIKPNIRDKVANKLAGMVDIVARVVADDNVRVLSFKTNEVIFGGGRLPMMSESEIALDYDEFCKVYENANQTLTTAPEEKPARKKTRAAAAPEVEVAPVPEAEAEAEAEIEAQPVQVETLAPIEPEDGPETAAPVVVTRTRRKRV